MVMQKPTPGNFEGNSLQTVDTASPESGRAGKLKKWQRYVLLHAIILVYSFAAVCSKLAAESQIGAPAFFGWFAVALILLVIYAIIWQQLLKSLRLASAYVNKGATVIWGMLWGVLFFAERISLGMVIGAIIVLAGIILVVTVDE